MFLILPALVSMSSLQLLDRSRYVNVFNIREYIREMILPDFRGPLGNYLYVDKHGDISRSCPDGYGVLKSTDVHTLVSLKCVFELIFLNAGEERLSGETRQLNEWKQRCEVLEKELNSLKTLRRVVKQDQAAQAVVETRTCAVKAPIPAASCESACQTTSPHGSEHGCCEKAVQTANSISKLASRACWKCGEKGHLRKDCRNKGRRRRSARKKADNLPQACVSTNQGGSQPSQTVWVLAISDVGGVSEDGGASYIGPRPHPTTNLCQQLLEDSQTCNEEDQKEKEKREERQGGKGLIYIWAFWLRLHRQGHGLAVKGGV